MPMSNIAQNYTLSIFFHCQRALYTHSIHLLTTRHLGSIPLRSAHLQALVVPALRAKLVQCLLLLTVRHGTDLATPLPRLKCLG